MFLSTLNKTCDDNVSHKPSGRNLSHISLDPGSPSFMLKNVTLSSKGLKESHPFPTWMVHERGRSQHSYCLYKDSPKPNHHSQLARHWTRWKQSFPSAWAPPGYHSLFCLRCRHCNSREDRLSMAGLQDLRTQTLAHLHVHTTWFPMPLSQCPTFPRSSEDICHFIFLCYTKCRRKDCTLRP